MGSSAFSVDVYASTELQQAFFQFQLMIKVTLKMAFSAARYSYSSILISLGIVMASFCIFTLILAEQSSERIILKIIIILSIWELSNLLFVLKTQAL